MSPLHKIIKSGGVVVMPTDTLYGVHASALNRSAVKKIYKIKKRSLDKPLIVLISSIRDLRFFDVEMSHKVEKFLTKNWPGKLSVVLPVKSKKFGYLHRNKKSLAFRMPDNKYLVDLIEETGPLVSSTANTEGSLPAKTIKEAKKYFGDSVEYYLDKGFVNSDPSTLIKIDNDNKIVILRQGCYATRSLRAL